MLRDDEAKWLAEAEAEAHDTWIYTVVPTLCQRLEEERKYMQDWMKLNESCVAMAEALRERVEKCECQDEIEAGEQDQHCDLCRKSMALLEGRGT